jgi:toxin YoeB
MNIKFSPPGWIDYTYWQTQDKRIIKKINQLITDIARNGNTGLGKPEPLKGNLSGWYSGACGSLGN